MKDERVEGELQETSEEEPELQETEAEGEEAEETETEPAEVSDEEAEGEEDEAEEADKDDDSEPDYSKPIRPERFKRVYAKWRTEQRENADLAQKMNLLKTLGPDKYYELYPDERPQGAAGTPATQTTTAPPPGDRVPMMSECLDFAIQGGQYDGCTLRQLMESGDPVHQAAAYDHYNAFAESKRSEINEAKTRETQTKEQIEQEHTAFVEGRAQDLFGKAASELSAKEQRQIADLTNTLLDRMESGELKTYDLNTAYELATLNDRIKDAAGKSVKAIVEAMRKAGGVTHPETKTDGSRKTGYEPYLSYSDAQLADHLESLSEEGCQRFWEKAPKALRRKFPKAAAAWG